MAHAISRSLCFGHNHRSTATQALFAFNFIFQTIICSKVHIEFIFLSFCVEEWVCHQKEVLRMRNLSFLDIIFFVCFSYAVCCMEKDFICAICDVLQTIGAEKFGYPSSYFMLEMRMFIYNFKEKKWLKKNAIRTRAKNIGLSYMHASA